MHAHRHDAQRRHCASKHCQARVPHRHDGCNNERLIPQLRDKDLCAGEAKQPQIVFKVHEGEQRGPMKCNKKT